MEVGIKEVLEQLNTGLNHVETDLRAKADKWEMRIWFMTIMALLVAILGIVVAKA